MDTPGGHLPEGLHALEHAAGLPGSTDYDASRDSLPSRLSGHGGERVDFNQVEINRCHAFIDPVCDSRLMEALLLQPPKEKLALPRFYMENQHTNNDPTHLHGPHIRTNPGRARQHQPAAFRPGITPQAGRPAVNHRGGGWRRACPAYLNTANSQTLHSIEEGDELIEVRTRFAE